MKILFLHSSSDLYGASRILLNTVIQCIKADHQVLVCLSEPGILAKKLEEAGAQVIVLRLGVLRRKYMNVPGLINRLWFITQACLKLIKIIKAHQIDLVYNNASSILSANLAARFCKTPHLWHIHEIIVSPAFFAKFVAYCMYYISDLNVVVSEATKKHWINILPKLSSKLKVIYNGVDPDSLKVIDSWQDSSSITADEAIRIGMIARVHFWKGQSYFMDIAAELVKKYDHIRFIMAGDAFPGYEYLYEELAEKKKKLGLEDKIVDLGYLEDPSDFFSSIDVFVLPSILPDPLPTTVLEAMAAEKPVVATRHGGAVEMVRDGETGFLISWENAVEASLAIGKLIEDEELRTSMGEAGKKRVIENFSIETNRKAILDTLIDLVHVK